jgi:hypothetical protein
MRTRPHCDIPGCSAFHKGTSTPPLSAPPRSEDMNQERLPDPEGEGWDEEVRITKRDLHAMLNAHGDVVRSAIEPLDVERLAKALKPAYVEGLLEPLPTWNLSEIAEYIAAEYARLRSSDVI